MTKRYVVKRNTSDGAWRVVDTVAGGCLRYHIENSANDMASHLNYAYESDWIPTSRTPIQEAVARLESEHLPHLDRLGGDWNQVARDIRDLIEALPRFFEEGEKVNVPVR